MATSSLPKAVIRTTEISGMFGPHPLDQLQAPHVRHHQVGEDDRGLLARDGRRALRSRRRHRRPGCPASVRATGRRADGRTPSHPPPGWSSARSVCTPGRSPLGATTPGPGMKSLMTLDLPGTTIRGDRSRRSWRRRRSLKSRRSSSTPSLRSRHSAAWRDDSRGFPGRIPSSRGPWLRRGVLVDGSRPPRTTHNGQRTREVKRSTARASTAAARCR